MTWIQLIIKGNASLLNTFQKEMAEAIPEDNNMDITKDIPEVTDDSTSEIWETTFQGKKYYGAFGHRDVLIIQTNDSLEGRNIVPRKECYLPPQDKVKLTREGIPPECWNDEANLMKARYHKDTLVCIQSDPEMTVNHILVKITELLETTKKPGVVVIYFGPGKRQTGDWCFKDGFITFDDMKELYNRYFAGKTMMIISDCSYSGEWVQSCMDYLDECKVQPCVHSAKAANKILSVSASCEPDEIPYKFVMSVRGCCNDSDTGANYMQLNGFQLAEDQHIHYCISSRITCKATNIDAPCLLPKDDTWEARGNWKTGQRVFSVTYPTYPRTWVYIVLDDDADTSDFARWEQLSNMITNGKIFLSGLGENPPSLVQQMVATEYPDTNIEYINPPSLAQQMVATEYPDTNIEYK